MLALLVATATVLLLLVNLEGTRSDVGVGDVSGGGTSRTSTGTGSGADAVTRGIAPAGPSDSERRPTAPARSASGGGHQDSAAGWSLGVGDRAPSAAASGGAERGG